MSKTEIQSRLYACCSKNDCRTYGDILDFLRIWGLPVVPQKEGSKTYFDIAIPSYWGKSRRSTFVKGLSVLKTKH
jgi:hypothetical protein